MSPNCSTCDTREDVDHLFWACPNYADERKIFFDKLQIEGVARSTTQDIQSPPGSVRDARKNILLSFRIPGRYLPSGPLVEVPTVLRIDIQ